MRRALIYSLALHVAVAAVGFLSGVFWTTKAPLMETAVVVELVPVAEKTNVPVRKPPEAAAKAETKTRPPAKPNQSAALKQPEPKPKVDRPPAEPAPQPKAKAKEATPEPTPPKPAPEPKATKAPPEPTPPKPAPKPKAKEAVAPKPDPKPQPKPDTEVADTKLKPDTAETPPSSFDSVLKTVEALKARESKPGKPSEQSTDDAPSRSKSARYDSTQPVTISEIDSVRRQIERCWNLPAGARGAENMVVSIRVEMNIDGTPGVAAVVEKERMRGDPSFRAAAESALRAVLNPRCHPFGLPRDKYESWKTMTLVFDPKEMFGT